MVLKNDSIYQKNESIRVACGGEKEAVTDVVRDTPQAYELMEPETAVRDFGWAISYITLVTGLDTVTYLRECPAATFLGGTVQTALLSSCATTVLLLA